MNVITRILWVGLVAAIALGTAAIQLDRQSRYVPSVAGGVPEPVRAFAQTHITAAAIQSADNASALREARKLVARRPMPAAHLRLLGYAQFAVGEDEASVVTMQRAARRGWRDPIAQEGMLRLALAAGDKAEAARRFAALFVKSSSDEAKLVELGEVIFAQDSEASRETFADIVSGAERWHPIYFRKGPATIPTEAMIDITRRAINKGARFDCKLAEQAANRLRSGDQSAGDRLLALFPECSA